MMLLLFLLALGMIVTGIASAIFGAPIVQLERGHTMIIAGSGVASAGAILFGLTFVCYRLKKIQREVRRLGDRLIRHGEGYRAGAGQGVAAGRPEPSLAGAGGLGSIGPGETTEAELLPPLDRAPEPPPPAAPPPPEPSRAAPTVVGKYASGGNSYVMYSDGSIQADTPSGRHRFSSLDELKAFVAGGGERQAAR